MENSSITLIIIITSFFLFRHFLDNFILLGRLGLKNTQTALQLRGNAPSPMCILGMTLNYIWWWGLGFEFLWTWSTVTLRSTLNRIVVPVKVLDMVPTYVIMDYSPSIYTDSTWYSAREPPGWVELMHYTLGGAGLGCTSVGRVLSARIWSDVS